MEVILNFGEDSIDEKIIINLSFNLNNYSKIIFRLITNNFDFFY